MGMTSKLARQTTERPKPPTWEEISEDIGAAKSDDIVFQIGKEESKTVFSGSVQGTSVKPGPNMGNTKSRSGSDSDLDTSSCDMSTVHESCEKVERLLELYDQLKDRPSDLQEQYANLKDLGKDMVHSITELKALSQSFMAQTESSTQETKSSPRQDFTGSKSKSKHKKKK